MRDIALVTGASSGIGKEFVRQIAKKYKGFDEIWVIARRKDKLRELKKEINFISNELIAECLFNKLYIKNSDPQKIDELLSRIINCQDDFLRRVNTPDGKENPKLVKKYYKSLIQSFDNKIGEILKELGELNK